MGKIIETTLTGDSTQLRAEFARAEKATAEYEKRVAGSQGLAKRAALDNVRALQLEASGRQAAAEAMRQEMELQEAARRLAKQAGISEQGAVGILRRKLELETRIADQKSRARRIAGGGVALPEAGLTPQYLANMEKGAMRAKELRRQVLRAGRGGYTGAMGFLAFSQAVEDAQYGIRGVLNNIPQMVLGFGGGAGIAGAISLAAVAGVALYPVLKRLYGAADTERLKKAAEAWGEIFEQGVKASRQMAEERDLAKEIGEYVRQRQVYANKWIQTETGVLDNLEKEISLRATAAGLAADLAAAQESAAQRRGEDTGAFSEEKRKREMDGLKEDLATRKRLMDAATEQARRVREGQESLAGGYAQELAGQETGIIELTKDLAAAAANVAAAKKELEDKGLKGAERANVKIGLGNSEAAQQRINAELERLKGERDALKVLAEATDAKARGALESLNQRINASYQEAEAIKLVIAQREKLFQVQRAEEEAVRREAAAAKAKRAKEFELEGRILEAKAAGNDRLESSLERQRDIEALKLDLMEQQGLSAGRALAQATRRVDLEKRSARAAEEQARLKQRAAAGQDFAGEIAVLRLAASGRQAAAEALRKEIEVRKEGKDLAESLGLAEAAGLKLAREKEALERRIAAQKNTPERRAGTIYKLTAEESAERRRLRAGAFRGGDNGLRRSAAAQFERLQARDPGGRDRAAAAQYYERSISAQESLVKIFNKLGVA